MSDGRSWTIRFGMWVWGTLTALLAVGIVYVIATGDPAPVYLRVRDAATALGAVVAASALAWAHFYQSWTDNENKSNSREILLRLERIENGLRRKEVP